MSFGLKINNAAGVTVLDENSFTVRVIYTDIVTMTGAAKQAISIPLASDISTSNAIAFVIPIADFTNTAANSQKQFEVQLLTGSVNVYNYAWSDTDSPNTTVATGSMRLIVLRFA